MKTTTSQKILIAIISISILIAHTIFMSNVDTSTRPTEPVTTQHLY